jgi:hypothetical protein
LQQPAVTQAEARKFFAAFPVTTKKVFFDCFLAFNFMMKHERIRFQGGIVFVTDLLRKFECCFLKI